MTSEIVIMNKNAVAIASDSAVTTQNEKGKKIFTSSNKIFALSKYHPIGIMIYNNASFLNVPWEVIIKIYRKKLGTRAFDTLEDYANDFIKFLKENLDLFPKSEREKFFEEHIKTYYIIIRDEIKERVNKSIKKNESISLDEINEEITSKVIENHYNKWDAYEYAKPNNPDIFNSLLTAFKTNIKDIINKIFENLTLSDSIIEKLTNLAVFLFLKDSEDFILTVETGVVFVGFGEKDIFPSLRSYFFCGLIDSFLEYKEQISFNITHRIRWGILPFAQSEMIVRFMEGIDPLYKDIIEELIKEIVEEYPKLLIEKLKKNKVNINTDIEKKIKQKSKEEIDEILSNLRMFREEIFVNPITSVVSILPKDELAAMAESLVNLTSFKRKVSMEEESVGGPIDVAIISKGDGFIWIKRKHYFEPKFNPQFFANYYRGMEDE